MIDFLVFVIKNLLNLETLWLDSFFSSPELIFNLIIIYFLSKRIIRGWKWFYILFIKEKNQKQRKMRENYNFNLVLVIQINWTKNHNCIQDTEKYLIINCLSKVNNQNKTNKLIFWKIINVFYFLCFFSVSFFIKVARIQQNYIIYKHNE